MSKATPIPLTPCGTISYKYLIGFGCNLGCNVGDREGYPRNPLNRSELP